MSQRSAVHLHHAQGQPLPPARPRGAEGHQPVLLPGRQDRRDRPQRLRQVVAAADHGRRRRRLHRRGPPLPRLHRRACSSRSPSSTRAKDVMGNVMDGVAEVAGLLERYDAVLAKYADPDADYEKLGAEQAELEAKIEAAGAWDLERTDRDRHGRPAPARRATPTSPRSPAASGAGSPCAGCCCPGPTCCCSTSPPTTSTPSRWRGSSGPCSDYHGHRRRHHPRPLLPRQRGPLDPRARARPGPSRSRATTRAGSSRSRPASRQEEKQDSARQRTLERELEWVRMAPEGPPGQGQGPPRRLREAAGRGRGGRARRRQARDPASRRATASATW